MMLAWAQMEEVEKFVVRVLELFKTSILPIFLQI